MPDIRYLKNFLESIRPKLIATNQAKLLAGYPAKCFLTLKCCFRVPDPGLDGGEQEVVHAEHTKTETDSSVIGLQKGTFL